MLPGRLRVTKSLVLALLYWRPQGQRFPLRRQANAVGNAQVCLISGVMGRWEEGPTALSRLASPSGPGETIQSVKCMLCKSDGLSQIPRTRVKMPDTVA